MYRPREIWPETFRLAFCRKFSFRAEEYPVRVFRRTLYRHALPVAVILHRFKPEFFQEDFDLIREVGELNDPDLFRSEVNCFFGRNVRDRNWLRRTLRIRVSGDRLLALKNSVFRGPCSKAMVLQ